MSAVWENRVASQRLMLVLTGSAVGVNQQMPGASGGLHRRASLELRMDPFPADQARPFLPSLPAAEFMIAYASAADVVGPAPSSEPAAPR